MFENEMKRAAKDERYEDAARLRDQLKSLQRIQDIALLNKSFVSETTDHRLQTTVGPNKAAVRSPSTVVHSLRIEGYDISNIGASEKVGSMVVFDVYGPVKEQYRKFIIRGVAGQSDVDSLAEVLERRLRHDEWPLPDVILVDGGRAQVNRVVQVLSRSERDPAAAGQVRRVSVPVVGIAKGPERKRNDLILGTISKEFIAWVHAHKSLLVKVRDEAHRFAITFHRERRGRQFKKRP